jgi:hypothetical protein
LGEKKSGDSGYHQIDKMVKFTKEIIK